MGGGPPNPPYVSVTMDGATVSVIGAVVVVGAAVGAPGQDLLEPLWLTG